MSLNGKVCLVTGASRGLGKGIALQLGEAGATVYITGRASSNRTADVGGTLKETADEISHRGGRGIPIFCDHSKEEEVKSVFDKISADHGRLDVLVNNAYAAANSIASESKAGHKFWEYEGTPGQWWDLVNNVGLRNNYICCTFAAQMMVPTRNGLIVNVSSGGGLRYLFNVAYGVGKAAVDRMSADMAIELKSQNVACLTLYPGAVLTEEIQSSLKTEEHNSDPAAQRLRRVFSQAETPEFAGKAVAALAADPNVITKTGRICIAADLAQEYAFTDVDGSQPPSLRQVNYLLRSRGYTRLASFIPGFIKIPGFAMAAGTSKF